MKFAASLVSLAVATSAVSANFLPKAFQCAKDLRYLSCSTDNVPLDSCCYNGALVAGGEQSGLILATQFWNAQPSIGPKDSATIHGLWPDYCSGRYPAFCSKDSGIPEATGDQIRSTLEKWAPKTLQYMNEYWKDNKGNDSDFWSHESVKHQTCMPTLRLECQRPRKGQTAFEASLVGYFEESVRQFKRTPTYDWLTQAGIYPSNTTTYTLAELEGALAKRHGAIPYLGCTGSSKDQLDEFWYYNHVRGPVVGGLYVPVNSTSPSSCPATGIKWLPK